MLLGALRQSDSGGSRTAARRLLVGRKRGAAPEPVPVARDIPDTIVLKRHRGLEGLHGGVWIRRAFITLFVALPIVALFNVFGQRPSPVSATVRAASLELYAPVHVRGGLIWEARFRITARRELEKAILVLDHGWLEGMTVNTIEPSPLGEGSHDGKLVLELGHVPAGETYVLFMQFQVDPTNVGRRSQTVRLYDGDELLLTMPRKVTVFP